MRNLLITAAVGLSLSVAAGGLTATPPPAPRADTLAGTTAPSVAKPAAAMPAAPPPSDAAARHAKRTACLKDAKTKKLVGADKISFLKSCMAAP